MRKADFVAAICASPEDDALRLVYADWLDENGEEARAEFIRLQLQMEGLHRREPARRALEERANTLLKEHRETWLRELPEWARKHAEFRRGFVHHIEPTSQARQALPGNDSAWAAVVSWCQGGCAWGSENDRSLTDTAPSSCGEN
jgi:uncharacterized protein (TIGR02996 family)